MSNFGQRIRKFREEKQLPLRTVAGYLDIDQAILSKIERGQRNASRVQVVKLAKYFKAKEEELLALWLSDKLIYEMKDEEAALQALKLAEEEVLYRRHQKFDRKSIIKTIKDYFTKDGRISKAWLFGSFAREEDDFKSDIDLMIEVPQKVTFSLFDLADIQFHLENLIPMKVDVVMNGAVKPHIMERIKPDLKIIYER